MVSARVTASSWSRASRRPSWCRSPGRRSYRGPAHRARGVRGGRSARRAGTAPALRCRSGPRTGATRPVGALEITLRDRWRLSEGRATVELPRVDCYPLPAAQSSRVVLSRLPSRLGEHPSRAPGEGIEFAGVREFVPGDRQRRINWPATTRRGSLQLNTFAAERTQNVVVLADATADVGEPGATTLDLAFRGAAGTIPALPGRPGPGRPDRVRRPAELDRARPRPAAVSPGDGPAAGSQPAAGSGRGAQPAAPGRAAARRADPGVQPAAATGGWSRPCATCASAASAC